MWFTWVIASNDDGTYIENLNISVGSKRPSFVCYFWPISRIFAVGPCGWHELLDLNQKSKETLDHIWMSAVGSKEASFVGYFWTTGCTFIQPPVYLLFSLNTFLLLLFLDSSSLHLQLQPPEYLLLAQVAGAQSWWLHHVKVWKTEVRWIYVDVDRRRYT